MESRNSWVENYLDALLTHGLSNEYSKEPQADSDQVERFGNQQDLAATYYVQQVLNQDWEGIRQAWSKASSAHGHFHEQDARLEYLTWRVWFMKCRREAIELDMEREMSADLEATEPIGDSSCSDPDSAEELDHDHNKAVGAALNLRLSTVAEQDWSSPAALDGEVPTSPTTALEAFEHRVDKLYIVLISLHGLVRGQNMELGKDPDTGGQVKYVVELAKNLAMHPAVHRVELMTRMIKDPKVAADYGEPVECLYEGNGQYGGAYIVRLPCGPTDVYVRKEDLWPHVREFADNGIEHVQNMCRELPQAGEPCELYAVHGHYADAGEVAALMADSLGVDMLLTGHSLGRNKLDHLLKAGTISRKQIDETYRITRRIEAEERALDAAMMVFTSTQQEVDLQWGLYNGYDNALAHALRMRRRAGRVMPKMKVIPPGLDFSNLKVELPEDPVAQVFLDSAAGSARSSKRSSMTGEGELESPRNGRSSPRTDRSSPGLGPTSPQSAGRRMGGHQSPRRGLTRSTGSQLALDEMSGTAHHAQGQLEQVGVSLNVEDEDPPFWKKVHRFLRNPRKPVILAMSRPDAKKNITTLIQAYGENRALNEIANLVLIMGNRDDINAMPRGSQIVLERVLKMIDRYDLYGSVAYPKRHRQDDISDIYRLAADTRGVFTNIALQEPFGLTLIEAAAHGVPIVATQHGGPTDIIATLKNGLLVEPTDATAVGEAILKLVMDKGMWEACSLSGINNMHAYSWPAHCIRYLEAVEFEKRHSARRRRALAHTLSGSWEQTASHAAAVVDEQPSLGHDEFPATAGRMASLPAQTLADSTPNAPLAPSGTGELATSADDADVATASAAPSSAVPRGLIRDRLVVATIDIGQMAESVIRALRLAIDACNAGQSAAFSKTGFGVSSMLGYQTTCDLLEAFGVGVAELDFVVCNAGADIWHWTSHGCMTQDETYEQLLGELWDKLMTVRYLARILWKKGGNLPVLKFVDGIKNVEGDASKQVIFETGPYHILMEVDRSAAPGAANQEVLQHLRARLRAHGVRVRLTLQDVPCPGAPGDARTILHCTPRLGHRANALRRVLAQYQVPASASALLMQPRSAGENDNPVAVHFATSDASDLFGGKPPVVLLPPSPAAASSALLRTDGGELSDLTPFAARISEATDAEHAARMLHENTPTRE